VKFLVVKSPMNVVLLLSLPKIIEAKIVIFVKVKLLEGCLFFSKGSTLAHPGIGSEIFELI